MKLPLDRSLKLLWFAIGVIVLLFLAGAGVMILSEVIGNADASREAVRIASEAAPEAQEPRIVRYGMPISVRGTDTRMVMVGPGQGYGGRSSGSGYYSDQGSGAALNVMFIDAGGVRLLLDRPAFIRDVDHPAARAENASAAEQEAPREWISYVAALDDSNGDRRVDGRDAMALYVTDLQGRNLRPVLRPPLRYQAHEAFGPGRILVYALEPPGGQAVPEERMRQRAFVYDIQASRLAPYAAMDSAAERAGRILAR